jgi:hypothetical protein
MTNEIRKLIRQKRRVHSKAKRFNRETDWIQFRNIRNKVISTIRKARDDYQTNLGNKLKGINPSHKSWWKLCGQISGIKQTTRGIPPLLKNDTFIYNDTEKADAFNNFFVLQTVLDESNNSVPDPVQSHHSLNNITITVSDVDDVLKLLNISKAFGPDLINPRLLKAGVTELKAPLCKNFNLSLSQFVFSADWKQANVTPVFKNGNAKEVKNYRPISLLSIVSKCTERCVYKYVHNYLLQNGVITPNQSGFTRGDSAINQLVEISNSFGKALDSGKEVRVVFCDISKAFDRVWHNGLLFKLEQYGITGCIPKWFRSYLNGRSQRVCLNGSFSQWKRIKAGVPQGSILVPLLFSIFINDIVRDIDASIKLFADDTSLYVTVESPNFAAKILNNDLQKIHH